MFLLRIKLIMQGEKRETSTKTCNETTLRDKLRVFVSRISPPLCLPQLTYNLQTQKICIFWATAQKTRCFDSSRFREKMYRVANLHFKHSKIKMRQSSVLYQKKEFWVEEKLLPKSWKGFQTIAQKLIQSCSYVRSFNFWTQVDNPVYFYHKINASFKLLAMSCANRFVWSFA